MRRTLVPVLLLVAVALSSSTILPLLSSSQLKLQALGVEGQQNDNTYSYRHNKRNILKNIFYNIPVDSPNYDQQEMEESQLSYSNEDNIRTEHNIIKKYDDRNGERFNKEQWHNYPRQLDRLHEYRNEYQNDKIKEDAEEMDINDYGTANEQYETLDDLKNKYNLDTSVNSDNVYNLEVADAYPLWNLNLDTATRNDDLNTPKPELSQIGLVEQNNQFLRNRVNRIDEALHDNDNMGDMVDENKVVSKRIFSFWSRVQGLSHKGHEILQRRRHMHTFYGMPQGDGSRALTAETRAILMRPPGSPLRWG